jgi:hypothetical protein
MYCWMKSNCVRRILVHIYSFIIHVCISLAILSINKSIYCNFSYNKKTHHHTTVIIRVYNRSIHDITLLTPPLTVQCAWVCRSSWSNYKLMYTRLLAHSSYSVRQCSGDSQYRRKVAWTTTYEASWEISGLHYSSTASLECLHRRSSYLMCCCTQCPRGSLSWRSTWGVYAAWGVYAWGVRGGKHESCTVSHVHWFIRVWMCKLCMCVLSSCTCVEDKACG